MSDNFACEILFALLAYNIKNQAFRGVVMSGINIDFKKWAAIVVCVMGGVAAIYVALKFALPVVLPFFLAWCISFAVTPLSRWISKKTHISERPLSVFLMIILLSVLSVLLFLVFSRILYEVQNLAAWAGEENGMLEGYIKDARAFFEDLFAKVPFSERFFGSDGLFSAWDGINDMLSDLVSESVKNISAGIPAAIASVLRALPDLVLFVVVSVIASFYFCFRKEKLGEIFAGILPEKYAKKLPDIKKSMAGTAIGYVKAYFLIFLMTFSELFAGFAILKVKYAFILAFVIAIIDILPVLGTGIVLVPWALVLLLSKNYYLGFGLLIMYGVILLVRQIAEPKIVSKNIGLPAPVTLVAMYAGFKLFGFFGMIIGPAAALICKTVFAGRIKTV